MEKVNILEIFRLAERVEKSAADFYAIVAARAEHYSVKSVFELIARQERKHGVTFNTLMNRSAEELKEAPREIFQQPEHSRPVEVVLSQFHPELQARLERYLRAEHETVRAVSEIKDPVQAIEVAIIFEEATVELYRELQKHVAMDSKPRVERLVNEEKGHLREFISLKGKVMKMIAPARSR